MVSELPGPYVLLLTAPFPLRPAAEVPSGQSAAEGTAESIADKGRESVGSYQERRSWSLTNGETLCEISKRGDTDT